MKGKGSTSDFAQERNAELRAAFFSRKVYSTDINNMRRLVATPSSRFWVDPYRARDVMSRMEADPDALSGMIPQRRRMYAALFERYSKIRKREPQKPKIQCVTDAIFNGAPEFFLTPRTARAIIYAR